MSWPREAEYMGGISTCVCLDFPATTIAKLRDYSTARIAVSTMHSSSDLMRRHHAPLNALRRSAKACDRCRKRRTKCLGNPPHPCVTCSNTGHVCVYTESQKKVMVSESYLFELQAQARHPQASLDGADDPGPRPADGSSPDIELGFTGIDNWVVGASGEYRKHPCSTAGCNPCENFYCQRVADIG